MLIILFWCLLVLSAQCGASNAIPISAVELSSSLGEDYDAHNAIDNDLTTRASTMDDAIAWLKLHFVQAYVDKVVIEKGRTHQSQCKFTVSTVDLTGKKTECGKYTNIPYDAPYFNETVQCDGDAGISAVLERTGCANKLRVFEIKVYGLGTYAT